MHKFLSICRRSYGMSKTERNVKVYYLLALIKK